LENHTETAGTPNVPEYVNRFVAAFRDGKSPAQIGRELELKFGTLLAHMSSAKRVGLVTAEEQFNFGQELRKTRSFRNGAERPFSHTPRITLKKTVRTVRKDLERKAPKAVAVSSSTMVPNHAAVMAAEGRPVFQVDGDHLWVMLAIPLTEIAPAVLNAAMKKVSG
jgi:hypothetical protein